MLAAFFAPGAPAFAMSGFLRTPHRGMRGLSGRPDPGVEKLRFPFRLARDLRRLDSRRDERAARSLDDAGRRIGAWRKARHARAGA